MSHAFDAGSLEQRYAFIDACPDTLLDEVVSLPIGTLPERVAGVVCWRESLLAGQLPPDDAWPSAEVAGPVRRALFELGLARFCRDRAELVDALLRDVLLGWARQTDALSRAVTDELRRLESLERKRLADEEVALAAQQRRKTQRVDLDASTRSRLTAEAQDHIARRATVADATIIERWSEPARAWAQIADVFGDLGQMLGRGYDLTPGVLKHMGWQNLLRLRELVERLPQLQAIIRALGRLHTPVDGESVAEKVLLPVRRIEEELREVRTRLSPTETRGIERSGDLARMLPSEAVLLGHPRLRMLWHARRAERALVTYRVEGVTFERVQILRESTVESEGRRPRPERGPIVVIVDTSGSMQGLPEQVAKALVLETLRTALAEKRRCFVYAFSGPGQVIEHELALDETGIGHLLSFLALSFGGGTDGTGVMLRALERIRGEAWSRADVLFVSDGEWPAPPGLVRAVRDAKERGARFHGIQVGNRGQTGLHKVCEPVHVFQDWAAAGGW
nr:VWA domain-containing protein [Deltaproteobacteria bacterium]